MSQSVEKRRGRLSGTARIAFGLWFLFFVASPFYVLPSGQPQPADYLVPLIAAALFVSGVGVSVTAQVPLLATRNFYLWIAVVTCAWSLLALGETNQEIYSYLKYLMYYTFNILAVHCFARLATISKNAAVTATLLGTACSIVIQGAIIFVEHGVGQMSQRGSSTFNNPNQLAYFALLNGVICLAVGRYYLDRPAAQNWLNKLCVAIPAGILPMVLYLVYVSGSRSGLAGAAVLAVTTFTKNTRLLAAFVLIAGCASIYFSDKVLETFNNRMNRRSDQELVGNAVARYHRLFDYPQYAVLGAAEGNTARFDGGIEIHSTPGTLLFAYGLIGTYLFIIIYYRLFSVGGWWFLLMCAPPIVYGLSHNGLRQTEFWLMPVIFYLIANETDKSRKQRG